MERRAISFTKLFYYFSSISKRIWFRAVIYALAGIGTAFVALIGKDYVPNDFFSKIGADSVGDILSILASSMLAVATFSLSVMVISFGNVSREATPRAARLLIEDQQSQTAVATFIGAFLYSIVGIITLATDIYGRNGRVILFFVTIGVIILITVTLIRWVQQLSTLGLMGETIRRLESVTLGALRKRAKQPFLGGQPIGDKAQTPHPILASAVGFICFIDADGLQDLCEENNLNIRLGNLPGDFIYPKQPIAFVDQEVGGDLSEKINSLFVIERARTFEQDPRYGFTVLSEIASRALSAAVNDPGTAVEVLGTYVWLFFQWSELKRGNRNLKVLYPRVFVEPLYEADMMEDAYRPILRDGGRFIEVGIKLQHSLAALHRFDEASYGNAVLLYSQEAKKISDRDLESDLEKRKVAAIAVA